MISITTNVTTAVNSPSSIKLESKRMQKRGDASYISMLSSCWTDLRVPFTQYHTVSYQLPYIASSRSRIWSKGGPRNFSRDFADVAKRSQMSEASQYRLGSMARLRVLEALAFLTVKYAFSHFSWYFFFKKLTSIYVGTLQNIYFYI